MRAAGTTLTLQELQDEVAKTDNLMNVRVFVVDRYGNPRRIRSVTADGGVIELMLEA